MDEDFSIGTEKVECLRMLRVVRSLRAYNDRTEDLAEQEREAREVRNYRDIDEAVRFGLVSEADAHYRRNAEGREKW